MVIQSRVVHFVKLQNNGLYREQLVFAMLDFTMIQRIDYVEVLI